MGDVQGSAGLIPRAFGFAVTIVPIVSTLLFRRSADRSIDIVNEVEENLDEGTIDLDKAALVLRALRLSRRQLIIPTNVQGLLRAHDQVSREIERAEGGATR